MKILAEVGNEGIKLCYDAGSVLDYEELDPIPDIRTCRRDIRAFAIKDHRTVPKNQDCAPASERSTTTSCSRLCCVQV